MKLYQHQQKILKQNPEKCLLAWSTGTGKTVAALKLVDQNKTGNDIPLIVCPKSIKEQWREAIKKFTDWKDYQLYTKEEFRKLAKQLPATNFLIIDEAHFFSNYKSQMAKALFYYLRVHNPKYRYILTATPYLSTILNIYTLGLILDLHKKYKNWNWRYFRITYFQEVKFGNRTIPVERKTLNGLPMEEIVANLVRKMGDVVKLEDCIDVPEQIYLTEYFDLTKEQKDAIENLEEVNHIARWTKIHQICGGTLKSDGYTPDQFYKSEKVKRLKELANEHQKLVVVCRYNNEINYLARELKKDVYIITGQVKDRHSVVKKAESSKRAIVLIQAACSEGYELPSFPIMIFYSYDFSLKNYIQIKGRIQRINNIKKNVYISLVVKNTIDEDVYKTIMRKRDFDITLYKKENNKNKYERK